MANNNVMSLYELVKKPNSIETIKSLIDKGDNINKTDENGKAPLHYAVTTGYKMVKALFRIIVW